MKTEIFKKHYLQAKQDLKKVVHKIMVTRMVLQNIANLVPDDWQLETASWGAAITYKPAAGKTITLDAFDKFMARFAKATCCEPDKDISKDHVEYTFRFYPTFQNPYNWTASAVIEFRIGNTEACDVEVVREMREVTKLTGYCKALAEKEYLKN